MNPTELAKLFIAYEEAQQKANAFRQMIETEVLALEKTQVVGNVRATYYSGKKTYDYGEAWFTHGRNTGVDIEDFQKVTYDYKKACEAARIDKDLIPFTQSLPSVTVKLETKE